MSELDEVLKERDELTAERDALRERVEGLTASLKASLANTEEAQEAQHRLADGLAAAAEDARRAHVERDELRQKVKRLEQDLEAERQEVELKHAALKGAWADCAELRTRVEELRMELAEAVRQREKLKADLVHERKEWRATVDEEGRVRLEPPGERHAVRENGDCAEWCKACEAKLKSSAELPEPTTADAFATVRELVEELSEGQEERPGWRVMREELALLERRMGALDALRTTAQAFAMVRRILRARLLVARGGVQPEDPDPGDVALTLLERRMGALQRVAKDWLNTMHADGYSCCCEDGDPCPLCRCEAALKGADQNRLAMLIKDFDDEVRRTEEERDRPKGGMSVPFFGDFQHCPPAILRRLRWWANAFKKALP